MLCTTLDLSHGLCGPQYNAVTNIKDYYNKGVKAVSPTAYMICEHWGSSAGTDRPQLINEGMLCWENTNNAYCQTAMGWLKDGDSFANANNDGYVSYCESHDEERMQYKCKQYGNGAIKTDLATRIGRVPENVVMNVLLNGPHMIWQFEEIGYDFSINSEDRHPDTYKEDYRCNKKPRPEVHGYFSDPNRVKAYEKCAQAIQLRTKILPNVFAGNPMHNYVEVECPEVLKNTPGVHANGQGGGWGDSEIWMRVCERGTGETLPSSSTRFRSGFKSSSQRTICVVRR